MIEDTNTPPSPDPIESDSQETTAKIHLTPLGAFFLMIAVFLLGLGAGYLIWARPLEARAVAAEQKFAVSQKTAVAASTASANQANQADQQANVDQQQVKRYDVPIDDDPILGNKDAPITIIEFSDYECPFCVKWQQEVYPQIAEKYGDKVRLVYRDFPLYGVHPNAETAAEAANCAGAQKKYFEYHDLLFSGQPLGEQTYENYAQKINLNIDSFKKCMSEHQYLNEVKADYSYASELGVRSTPTFFINGLAVVGAQPFEVFQQVIDLELSGKIPK